ncbi:hypothetical protein [Propionivibrio sp.]|uniref:hypothetical protein n=1 Tax=Propionivibrio sp. TaxID=2212460 RepID=UPI0025DC9102|nr:hypothetical protein [Propionivibrio sp.]MBK8745946.1 hypothetical protein [Propionivibrio sp.]
MAEVIKVDISRVDRTRLKQLAINLKPLERRFLPKKWKATSRCSSVMTWASISFRVITCPSCGHQGQEPAHFRTVAAASARSAQRDADHAEVETVFKQEPMLTYNLLRLTNSVGAGMTTRITTATRHYHVGRRHRCARSSFCSTAVFRFTAGRQSVAATGGHALPADGAAGRKNARREGPRPNLLDQACMVGILSLMPTLVGQATCPKS